MPILDEMLAIFGRDSVTVNIYSLHFVCFITFCLLSEGAMWRIVFFYAMS
jgi:hypothetical protein